MNAKFRKQFGALDGISDLIEGTVKHRGFIALICEIRQDSGPIWVNRMIFVQKTEHNAVCALIEKLLCFQAHHGEEFFAVTEISRPRPHHAHHGKIRHLFHPLQAGQGRGKPAELKGTVEFDAVNRKPQSLFYIFCASRAEFRMNCSKHKRLISLFQNTAVFPVRTENRPRENKVS